MSRAVGGGIFKGGLLGLGATNVLGGCDIINLCSSNPTFSSTFNPPSCVCVSVCVFWGRGSAFPFYTEVRKCAPKLNQNVTIR